MTSTGMIVFECFILIPLFISSMFIPYWTRKTISFGVSIPEEIYHQKKLVNMRKRYTRVTGLISLIFLVIFLLISLININHPLLVSNVLSVLIFVYIVVSFLVFYSFYRKMRVIKQGADWQRGKSQHVVVSTSFRNQKLTHSNKWFLLSFVIVLVTLLVPLSMYSDIPNKIATHYDFAGNVTNWSEKSYHLILMIPAMQMYLTLLFLFLNTMIRRSKQTINAERPEVSLQQNMIFRRRWSTYIIFMSLAMNVMFAAIQFSFIYKAFLHLAIILSLGVSIVVVIWAVVLAAITGQGGSRLNVSGSSTSSLSSKTMNRDDDDNWKAGQFYFNRKDPALFVEKRFGVGWTINLARPLAWIIFILIIALAIVIPILLGK